MTQKVPRKWHTTFGYRFVKNIERLHRNCILYAHPAHRCCYRLLAFPVSLCCLVRVLGIGSGCTRPSETGPSPARGQTSSNRTSWGHFKVSLQVYKSFKLQMYFPNTPVQHKFVLHNLICMLWYFVFLPFWGIVFGKCVSVSTQLAIGLHNLYGNIYKHNDTFSF